MTRDEPIMELLWFVFTISGRLSSMEEDRWLQVLRDHSDYCWKEL